MSVATAAGIMLIVLPVAFNAIFGALAATFDYPDILRRPSGEVLKRFNAGGTQLIVLWWAFTLTAVALAPLAILLSSALYDASATLRFLAAAFGVLASLVQFLGIVRWPFLVPYLARVSTDADTTPAQREAADVVFQSFNRYLGVAVGEHLGYLFTGGWSVLAGLAMTQSPVVPDWLGVVGIGVGLLLVLCSLEFVGPFEPAGWKVAAAITPVTYVVWSIWLVAVGTALLL